MTSHPVLVAIASAWLLCSLPLAALAQAAPTDTAIPPPDDAPYTYTIDDDPWPAFMELASTSLDDHPALRVQREEARTAHQSVESVGIRPDPTVSLAAVYLPWKPPSLNADPMSGVELGFSMPIWYPKALRAQREAVQSQASALEVGEESERIQLLIRAAGLYYEIFAIDRAIDALEDVKPLLQEHIELLKGRIPSGHASVVQIERVRLNLMRLEDQIHTQKDARPGKVAQLNTLLHRPHDQSLPSITAAQRASTERTTRVDIHPEQPLTDLSPLVKEGMAHRPTTRALERQKQSAQAEARAAAWAKRPELEVFGSWMFRAKPKSPSPMDDGMDMFSVGIQSTLPFSGRKRANAARDIADARSVAIDAAHDAFENELRGELAAKLEELHRAAEHARFYKDELIPQAQRVRKAAMAGLDANRADYEAWIDAEQQLAEIHVAFAQLEATILTHHAMIRMLTGRDLARAHNADVQGGDSP